HTQPIPNLSPYTTLFRSELEQQNDKKTIQLPYVWLNQTADYPHTSGLEFALEPFTKDSYSYRFYATEDVESIRVDLYDPDTLVRSEEHTSELQSRFDLVC